jgi:hypothetical protein
MNPTDRSGFSELLTLVAETYGRDFPRARMKLWWRLLEDYDLADVQAAVMAHLRDPDGGRFMPTPAHIIRHLEPADRDRALLAWAEVRGKLTDSRSARSDDPAIEAAVRDLGGWVHLGALPERDLPWRERDFIERYELHRREQSGLWRPALDRPRGRPAKIFELTRRLAVGRDAPHES